MYTELKSFSFLYIYIYIYIIHIIYIYIYAEICNTYPTSHIKSPYIVTQWFISHIFPHATSAPDVEVGAGHQASCRTDQQPLAARSVQQVLPAARATPATDGGFRRISAIPPDIKSGYHPIKIIDIYRVSEKS